MFNKSAEHLASFPKLNPNPIIETDDAGKIIFYNDAALETLKKIGMAAADAAAFLPEDFSEMLGSLTRGGTRQVYREVAINGHVFREDILYFSEFKSVRFYCYDISDAKWAHEALSRQNAIVAGVNRILNAALVSSSEEVLGKTCLSVAQEVTQSRFGFIGELDHDGGLSVIALSDPGWDTCKIIDKAEHENDLGTFKLHGIYGRVVLDGKPFFTNCPASHPDSIGTPEGHPMLNSFMGAPLVWEGRCIGIIAVANREGGYDDEGLEALVNIAFPMVQAFMSRRSSLKLRREHHAIKLSNMVVEAFVKNAGDAAYSGALDVILEAMGSQHGVLGYVDERQDLICPSMTKIFDQCHMSDKRIIYSKVRWSGRWGRALLEQKTFYSNEPGSVPAGHVPIQNSMAAPIMYQGEVLGLIHIANKSSGYGPDDIELIETIASKLAPVMHEQIRKAMREQELRDMVEFLHMVNNSLWLDELVRSAANFFQEKFGCEAVGIRLKKGDDFPYYETRGFSSEFVLAESSLCARDLTGEIIRDSAFNPVLACMCGNVIRKRFDPTKPFFTENGSFWTNSTTELLASTTEADRQARTRNRCNGEGYESVALIPLRLGTTQLGLLQLNDGRKGIFTPDSIALLERMAGVFAIAIEKAKVEDDLRSSEERLLYHIEHSPLAVIEWDSNFMVMRWAGEAENIFGWSASETVGKPIVELNMIFEDDLPIVNRTIEKLTSGELRHVVASNRNYTKNGKVIHCEWYNTVLIDADGRMTSVMSEVLDVTARNQAQEALRKAHEELERRVYERTMDLSQANRRFDDVLNAMPVYTILLNPEHHITFANRYFRERFGEPNGKRCYEFLFGRISPCETCETFKALQNMRPHEWEWLGPDGRNYYVHDFPFVDSDGETLILEVGIDITDMKKLQEQLRQAQKMEAIGQLAGGIAHDFNNRLAAITNNAFIITSKIGKDSIIQNNVSQILASAENAAILTRSLLAFSRKQVMSLKQIDINVLIRQVEGLLQRVIGEDVALVIRLGEVPLIIKADYAQLENVLMNLAINARDAMPRGGTLAIAAAMTKITESQISDCGLPKAGAYARVTVSDTGIGIDEETRTKIFDPFFTTKGNKGTGLGLSMAYGVLNQHGGSITVQSEPGAGTTFNIFLPLVAEVESQKRVDAVATGSEPLFAQRSGTLLLAEDDPEVRSSMAHLLTQFGYEVIVAEGGRDAIAKIAKFKDEIELIILDVLMPDKNGREVYDEARKLRPSIKALFMSGYSADVISSRGMLEKGFEYVSKPASPGELMAKIQELLQEKN